MSNPYCGNILQTSSSAIKQSLEQLNKKMKAFQVMRHARHFFKIKGLLLHIQILYIYKAG